PFLHPSPPARSPPRARPARPRSDKRSAEQSRLAIEPSKAPPLLRCRPTNRAALARYHGEIPCTGAKSDAADLARADRTSLGGLSTPHPLGRGIFRTPRPSSGPVSGTDIPAKHPHEIHREDERIDFSVRLARIIESRVRLALETRKTALKEPMQALVALENHLSRSRESLGEDGPEQNRVADTTLTDHEEAIDRRTTPFIEPGVRPEHVRGVVVLLFFGLTAEFPPPVVREITERKARAGVVVAKPRRHRREAVLSDRLQEALAEI